MHRCIVVIMTIYPSNQRVNHHTLQNAVFKVSPFIPKSYVYMTHITLSACETQLCGSPPAIHLRRKHAGSVNGVFFCDSIPVNVQKVNTLSPILFYPQSILNKSISNRFFSHPKLFTPTLYLHLKNPPFFKKFPRKKTATSSHHSADPVDSYPQQQRQEQQQIPQINYGLVPGKKKRRLAKHNNLIQ